MPLADTQRMRDMLESLFPGLRISNTPKPSGQRLVYFCSFDPTECDDPERQAWGNCVMKISQGLSPQSVAYIQREIDILNSLASPNFPKLLFNDIYSEDPISEEKFPFPLFITFEERIDGRALSACMKDFSDELAVSKLIRDLVLAMKPLWYRRPPIVHRDLKPENILIRSDHSIVIIDFGIAREAELDGVTFSFLPHGPGTPHYSSPEQATNDKRNITFKSDFFSIGVIAYELISGHNPFLGAPPHSRETILQRIIDHAPVPLNDLHLASDKFGAVVATLLQKQPYKRYRTVEILQDHLDQLRSSHGV